MVFSSTTTGSVLFVILRKVKGKKYKKKHLFMNYEFGGLWVYEYYQFLFLAPN